MRFEWAALMLAVMLLLNSGCAHRKPSDPVSTHVGVAMIAPAGTPRMQLLSNQTFQMAFPTAEPLPNYPATLIGSNLAPISVCVEIVVDEHGAVPSARILYALPECPLSTEEVPEPFTQAVLEAVTRWSFVPAEVCEFPSDVPANPECIGSTALKPVPIRLAFVFSFHIEDGKPHVGKRTANR